MTVKPLKDPSANYKHLLISCKGTTQQSLAKLHILGGEGAENPDMLMVILSESRDFDGLAGDRSWSHMWTTAQRFYMYGNIHSYRE